MAQPSVERKLKKLLVEFQQGRHEGSIHSIQTVDSLTVDERRRWRELRKSLENIGISLSAFEENKGFIVRFFQDAIENGALQEQGEQGQDQVSIQPSELDEQTVDRISLHSSASDVPLRNALRKSGGKSLRFAFPTSLTFTFPLSTVNVKNALQLRNLRKEAPLPVATEMLARHSLVVQPIVPHRYKTLILGKLSCGRTQKLKHGSLTSDSRISRSRQNYTSKAAAARHRPFVLFVRLGT